MRRMVSISSLIALAAVFAWTFACGDGSDADAATAFSISSSAFEDGGAIPVTYGCGPEQDWRKPSLPFSWKNVPVGTQSLVLLVDDPAPVAKYWVHWLVVNMPPATTALGENASQSGLPKGASQLTNSYGDDGYGGPCPPDGQHTYRVQLFALSQKAVAIDSKGKKGDALSAELTALKPLGVATYSGTFDKAAEAKAK